MASGIWREDKVSHAAYAHNVFIWQTHYPQKQKNLFLSIKILMLNNIYYTFLFNYRNYLFYYSKLEFSSVALAQPLVVIKPIAIM